MTEMSPRCKFFIDSITNFTESSSINNQNTFNTIVGENGLHYMDYSLDPQDVDTIRELILDGTLMPYCQYVVINNLRWSGAKGGDIYSESVVQMLTIAAQHELFVHRRKLWYRIYTYLFGAKQKAKRHG